MKLNLHLKIKPLTRTELHQMMSYCLWAEEDGYYLGNEKQFRKRHENIKAFLNDAIDKLEKQNEQT